MFDKRKFTSHSGLQLDWKIECDDLTDNDWKCLAFMANQILTSFGAVEGIPLGGLKFAYALREYVTKGPLLIADDVLTSGSSMLYHRSDRDAIGVVVFARDKPESWITPIFQLTRVRGDSG